MVSELQRLQNHMAVSIQSWIDSGILPWLGFQLVVAAILLAVSIWVARRIEPMLDARARRIRDNRDLLRVVVALLRRLHWMIFVALLLLALAVMRSAQTPPATLLQAILGLSLAWFVASVLSRIIRNRLIARVVSWSVWIFAAVMIIGISDDVSIVLDRIALPIGSGRFSLLTLLKLLVLLGAALWLATTAGNFIDQKVQSSEDLTPSVRVLFGKIVKIGLIILAAVIALSSAGVDLTAFTVLSGAVGVGLGFGLQKVVSNFVSGVIILLDKSIKPGDTITVGETFGWIRQLRARFVSVVTRDGREYLIPNEDFITQRVVNWSFTDDLVRLDVKFGTSYDDDPHRVSKLAIEAAASVPRVEADRQPVCWITEFGDSSVNYVLRFWIHDPQQGLTNVRGKVMLALWDTFKAHGVNIPFPQRDVTIRRAPPKDPQPS